VERFLPPFTLATALPATTVGAALADPNLPNIGARHFI